MVMLLAAALVSAVATVPGEANRDSRLGFLIGPDGTLLRIRAISMSATPIWPLLKGAPSTCAAAICAWPASTALACSGWT